MENEVLTIPNNVRFAALNPYLEDNIVKPVEKRTPGDEGRILWGEKDLYPGYRLMRMCQRFRASSRARWILSPGIISKSIYLNS